MKRRERKTNGDGYFIINRWTLGLTILGLFLNLLLAKGVLYFDIPLFLDNVGSILVAALCGPFLGMTVGFLSNVMNSMTDPISLYYGILSVFIALSAYHFSKVGCFKKIKWTILAGVSFSIIGGAGGSILTWFLYGGGIGEGISAPYALALQDMGFPTFWAQFTADMLIDLPDKMLTVAIIYLVLRYYPKKLYNCFPLSYLYDRNEEEIAKEKQRKHLYYRRMSVNASIVGLIALAAALISVTSTVLGVLYYYEDTVEQYRTTVDNVAKTAGDLIDGNKVETFLYKEGSDKRADYIETKEKLEALFDNFTNIEYLYVYRVETNNCYVVFDLDTPEVAGRQLGENIQFEQGIQEVLPQMIAGQKIEPQMNEGSYGRLITGYCPILNMKGETVAYACADISVESYYSYILIFIIKLLAVQFGICMLISAFAIWFAKRRFIIPIGDIVDQAVEFDATNSEEWLSQEREDKVHTGDEIEELYHTMMRVEDNIANNVVKMKEAERELLLSKDLEIKNHQLQLAVEKADAANSAKTDFYSRMSHDMRTPMNGIIGLVNLSKDEDEVSVLHENLDKIEKSSNYLLQLINDTLDMSKIESEKLELNIAPVQLDEFLSSITSITAMNASQKNIEVQIDKITAHRDIYFLADELRVKQIFMNLFSNAVKFTPNGGIIKIALEEEPTTTDTRWDVTFAISDSGLGMSEEFIQNKLYQPFSQENNSMTTKYAGTGLGLAIVKNLVELMGGEILVESQLGEGTTFTIHMGFDIVDSPKEVEKSIKDHRNVVLQELKDKTILLFEDHPLNTEIATKLLQKVGANVVHAANGQEGVELFAAKGDGYFDAILMDIRMPVMDGLEAARRIRENELDYAKTIPIIAMTANAYAEDRKQALEAGMNEHLGKPINPQQMYEVLAQLISQQGIE